MKRKGDWIMPSEGDRYAPRGEPARWIAVIFDTDAGAVADGHDKTRAADPLLRFLVSSSAKSPGFIRVKRDFNGVVCAIHRRDFFEWLDEQKRADAEQRLRGKQ